MIERERPDRGTEAIRRCGARARCYGDAAGGKLVYTQLGSFGIDLTASRLSSQFRNTIAGEALLPFCHCVMIDSMPLAGAPHRKYRMWWTRRRSSFCGWTQHCWRMTGGIMKGGVLTILWTYR
jgi:hypothetical protein